MKRRTALLVSLGLATLSCQIVLGLEEPAGVDIEPASNVDGGKQDPNDPCKHAYAPEPPTREEDSDPATKKSFWLATTHIDLPAKPGTGLDLDDSCTCQPDLRDGAAPCETPAANGGSPQYCDKSGGVDDAFGTQLSKLPTAGGIDPINRQFVDGVRTTMIYLSDYNGLENDSDVGVAFVGSGGIYTDLGCQGEARDNRITYNDPDLHDPPLPDKRRAALNDGCDRWSPAPNETVGAYPNRIATGALPAYVRNNTLVFRFKQIAASFFGSATKVTNGVAVVNLRKDGAIFRGSGFIAGRMAFSDLTDIVGRTSVTKPDSDGGEQPFCENDLWPIVGKQLCNARDTMVSQSEEFQNKVCDAASATIGFDVVQAQVSDDEFANPSPPSACANASVSCP